MTKKGKIYPVYGVACGVCGCIDFFFAPVDEVSDAPLVRGWHVSEEYGWICDIDYQALETAKATDY